MEQPECSIPTSATTIQQLPRPPSVMDDDEDIEFEVFNVPKKTSNENLGTFNDNNNISEQVIVDRIPRSNSKSSYSSSQPPVDGVADDVENEDQIEIETTGSSTGSHASTIKYENDKHAQVMAHSEQQFMTASATIIKTNEFDHLFEHSARETEKERKKKDRRIIGHLVRKRVENFLKIFDAYGEGIDGPQIRRKTVMGSFVSVIMRFIVIVLIAWKMYKVLSMTRSEDIGDIISINYNRSGSMYFMDIPTLQMNVSSKILFFERAEDGPSLQRIDIIDMYGLEKTFSTLSPSESFTLRKPLTKSIFGNANIGLNSFFPRNRDAETGFDSVNTFSTKTSTVSSILDPAEALYIQSNQDKDFIEHTVHLYLRFLDNLRGIKPCQLQIGMINSGILALLEDVDEYGNIIFEHQLQSHEDVYFATDSSTWAMSNIIPNETERASPKVLSEGISNSQFYLTTNFTTSNLVSFLQKKSVNGNLRNIAQIFLDRGISLPLFNEWTFIINYMNNFVYTSNKLICDDYEQDIDESSQTNPRLILNNSFIRKKLFPTDVRIISNNLGENDTTVLGFVKGDLSQQPPFYMIIAGFSGHSEVVTVSSMEITQGNNNTDDYRAVLFNVERSTSIPFADVDIYAPDDFQEQVANYQTLTNLPKALPINWIQQGLWKCSPEKYGDGFCDCDCGFVNDTLTVRDIDCNTILPNLFNSENPISKLSKVSCTSKGLLCSNSGQCISPSFIQGSKPCLYKASTFGQKKVTGFFGTTNDFYKSGGGKYCSECEGYNINNEQSTYSSHNSRFMCQVAPKGYVFGIDYLKKIESDTSICFPIRTKVGEMPFPTIISQFEELAMVSINRGMKTKLMNVSETSSINSAKYLSSKNELFGSSAFNIQTICIGKDHEKLASFGRVVSYNPFSKSLIVSKEFGLEFSQRIIPSSVQFYVGKTFSEDVVLDKINQQPLMVQIESLVDMGNYQHLTLQKAVDISMNLYTITFINGTRITIETIMPSKQSPTGGQKFVVRKSIHDFSLIQESTFSILTITSNTSLEIITQTELKSYFSIGSIIEFFTEDIYVGSSSIDIEYFQENYKFNMYDPGDRWKSVSYQPLTSLQIEYALFVVPIRKTFKTSTTSATPLDLCPREHSFLLNSSFPDFKIDPQRQHYFTCSLEATKDCTEYPEQDFCPSISFLDAEPTYKFEFDHLFQLNNKWKTMGNSLEKDIALGGATEVEYKYSFSQEYHFQHDSSSNDVDAEFTKGFNVNSNSTSNIFNGRLNFLGRSLDDAGIPAHSPILDFEVKIDLSPFCGEDIVKYGDGILQDIFSGILKETGSWRYTFRENAKNAEGAQQYARKVFTSPLTIKWDLSTLGEYNTNDKLILSPGYEFDFRATLRATSVYSSGFTGNADIKEVKLSIDSTSVSKTALDFSNRNKLVLNYIIQIDLTQSNQVFLIAESSVLLDLMTDVGGAMGVLSLGALFLKFWQMLVGQPSVFLRDVILADERKEERRKASPTFLDRVSSLLFGRKRRNRIAHLHPHSQAAYELK
ncbi:predicted protein [Naegleria gruberi]|uniref:Predicted protein n=1 Tax=Naegleria gruberi TaxID=5762 RepID=D2V7L4_NAEGR|nr:uncharacterized protein NAEGRDRAFT_64845 [Naegleria gruberi]EFC47269.1 predicted protein [Naegleria gruberi]|eukprot:XP_002680013.1 predicted protein [Naegleria gruberi strain NEG-M]